MRLLALLALVACKGPPKVDVDPVSLADATAFAHRFVAAAQPCVVDKLAPMFDREAFEAKLASATTAAAGRLSAQKLAESDTAAKVLCAWQDQALSYTVLHVRMVNGEPRPVLRRLVMDPRAKVVIVGYDELQLGTTKQDHQVRVVDLYPYIQGEWLSALLGGGGVAWEQAAKGFGDTMELVGKVNHARELQHAGKNVEALAVLDALPPTIHKLRSVEMMRVNVADGISVDAYRQALDEVATVFPNDPSIAMIEIDGAFLRKDFDAALRYIDLVDTAIGGDAFQDAIRALAYLARNGPGDADKASEHAAAATRTEPTLAKGWWVTLDVALGREQWAVAVGAIDELRRRFKAPFDDEMFKLPAYAKLVASHEFAAWRSKSRP